MLDLRNGNGPTVFSSEPALPQTDLPLLAFPPMLAARFLFPLDERRFGEHPNWLRAGRWFVFWGVVIGLFYAVVFRLVWRWFGEYQYIRWVPAAAILTTDLGFCGYRLLAAAANHISGLRSDEPGTARGPTLSGLVLVVLVAISKYAMLLSLPLGRFEPGLGDGGEAAGWGWLAYLYPQAVYRPLLLMPIWGRWGMALALCIGPPAPDASERTISLIRGARLRVPLGLWPAAWALTTWYCAPSLTHLAQGLGIGLGLMTIAYLTSFFLARRCGGQNETTLGTVGLVCELAFLSMYLPVASSIYWY